MPDNRAADVEAMLDLLEIEYPETPSLLDYEEPFGLLIGVILSAQTTDAAVNATLPSLWARYPNATALAAADQRDVEEIIHSLGFFRSKAKNIIGAARAVVERFGGAVPRAMDDLVTIPGVGRKSAGVILHHIYDEPAIIVDTHFGRVARRVGLVDEEVRDPVKVERMVADRLPRARWSSASMRLNYHGRRYCYARKPACAVCPLTDACPKVGVTTA